MPNWKKVIVSGSDASLNKLVVDTEISASIFSGSAFSGSFYGDGSDLTGIIVDDGLPRNDWDYNVEDDSPINDFQTGSTIYIIDFKNQILVGTPVGEIAWTGNITGKSQLIPSAEGIYILANDIDAGFIGVNGFSGSVVGIGNVMNYSASIDGRLNAFATTGSNTFIGNQIIDGNLTQTGNYIHSGSVYHSGSKILNGIFVQSGSLLISGSTTQIGNNTLTGNNNVLGNTIMSGSLEISGSNTIRGNTKVSGAFYIESSSLFYQNTGSALVSYDQTTGELFHTTYQSALPALFAAGGFYSTQTQSGSANVSSSFTYNGTLYINSVYVSGSSKIYVDKTATYNIQFSIQIVQGSQAAELAVWLRRNGTNVANTATYLTIPSNTKKVMALNLWETANEGDYFEIMYQSDQNNTTYQYIGATGHIPSSPSIIVTVNQVR
jgi:hypothetical protein